MLPASCDVCLSRCCVAGLFSALPLPPLFPARAVFLFPAPPVHLLRCFTSLCVSCSSFSAIRAPVSCPSVMPELVALVCRPSSLSLVLFFGGSALSSIFAFACSLAAEICPSFVNTWIAPPLSLFSLPLFWSACGFTGRFSVAPGVLGCRCGVNPLGFCPCHLASLPPPRLRFLSLLSAASS